MKYETTDDPFDDREFVFFRNCPQFVIGPSTCPARFSSMRSELLEKLKPSKKQLHEAPPRKNQAMYVRAEIMR